MKLSTFLQEDAGAMDQDQIWMTEIQLFVDSKSVKNKLAKWAEEVGAAFVKDYEPKKVVIEDKYNNEIMQAFQNDIDGTGASSFWSKDPVTGELRKEGFKSTESFKELSEGGTITGGGYWAGEDSLGNATGALGPAAGEDPPPGHGYLGNRYKRGDYYNRLTNFKTIWRVDDKEDFEWNWFDMCTGQDDYNNFSETIDGLQKLFPEDTWDNVTKKMTNVPARVRSRRFDTLKKQPYRTSYNTLGDHPEDQQGGTLTAKIPNEIVIEKYLGESTWTGMGDEPHTSYPDDGSGIASDDDRPPGNIILGPRAERRKYFNRLTQYNSIWDYDNKEDFKWDYFENLSGQDDYNNYSDTLKSMDKLFPEQVWDNVWKKMKNVPDKEVIKRFDIAGQPWRSKDDQLGDHPEDQMGGTETADVPKELDVQESLNLTDRIDKLLIDGCKKKKKKLTESKVAKTILKQINAIDRYALPSWGAKNYVSSDDSIQFDVRGSKFRGRVIITYDKGPDTYIIELGQVRKLEWKQKYMIKSVFAQDLVNVLDQQVG